MNRATAKYTITAEDKSKGALSSARGGLDQLTRGYGALMATIGGLVGTYGIVNFTNKILAAGDQMDKMSLRTGESVEDLSRLSYAANITGTDIESMEKSLKYLNNQMLDVSRGTGESKQTFDELGISVIDADGRMRGTVDVLKQLADKITAIDDPTRQAAYAMELLGARSGSMLIPMLKLGSQGIQELMDKSDQLGQTWSTKNASASAQFNDHLTDLRGSATGLGRELLMTVIPSLDSAAVSMTEWVTANKELIAAKVENTVERIGDALQTIGEHPDALENALTVSGTVLEGMTRTVEGWVLIGKTIKEVNDLFERLPMFKPTDQVFGGGGSRGKGASGGWEPETPLKMSMPNEFMYSGYYSPLGSKPTGGGKTSGAGFDMDFSGYATTKPREKAEYDLMAEDREMALTAQARVNRENEMSLAILDIRTETRELGLAGIEDFTERETALEELRYENYVKSLEEEYGYLENYNAIAEAAEQNHWMRLASIEQEALDRQKNSVIDFASTWGDTMYTMLSESGNVFENIANRFQTMMERMAVEATLGGIFNLATGGAGGFGGGFMDVLGSFFGGKRAGGGDVSPNKLYLVGEREPELFVPRTGGTIVPMSRIERSAESSTVIHDHRSLTVQLAVPERSGALTVYRFAELLNRAVDLDLVKGMKGASNGRR